MAKPKNSEIIVGLDIGTTKIACLIGRAEHGSLRILGAALRALPAARGIGYDRPQARHAARTGLF